MSKIMNQSITFDDVISQSSEILVVTKESTRLTKEKKFLEKEVPTYVYSVSQYKIVSTVKTSDSSLINGKIIEVLPPNLDTEISDYKDYHMSGLNVFPVIELYKTSANEDKDSPLILFLRKQSDGQLAFTCVGSFEKMDKLDQVKALILKYQAPHGATPVPQK